jgi:hypothetical protein
MATTNNGSRERAISKAALEMASAIGRLGYETTDNSQQVLCRAVLKAGRRRSDYNQIPGEYDEHSM